MRVAAVGVAAIEELVDSVGDVLGLYSDDSAAAAGATGGTGSRDIRRVLSQKDRVMISRDDIDNAFSQVSESASHLRVIEAENPLIAISL